MAEVKGQLVFRKEWVEQVKKIFDEKKSLENADKIPRVATPLLAAKPEAYIPEVVSLGPYHHWTLEKKIAASSSAGDSYEYRDLKMSTMEAYKVQSAAKFWKDRNASLDNIVGEIRRMQQQIQKFYDWPINSDGKFPDDFALMMAIDSSFLLHFLRTQSGVGVGASDSGRKRLEVSINCDIMKLENQIPLFVLRKLFHFDNLNVSEEDFSKLFLKSYKKLSPFDQFDIENNDVKIQIKEQGERLIGIAGTQTKDEGHSTKIPETQIKDEGHPTEIPETQIKDEGHSIEILSSDLHLLGCVHAVVAPLVHVIVEENRPKTSFQRVKHSLNLIVGAVFASIVRLKHPYEEGRHDILNSYNAGELKKAGINFKFFSKQFGQIRFDKYSGTLHLPQITVSGMQTEVFLRNMLAFEFNADPGGDSATPALESNAGPSVDSGTRNVGESETSYADNPMTRYVGLMDCLIDTAEDVRLLRESQVILRGSLLVSDESIAKMWKRLCHPIFTDHLEPPENLKTQLMDVLIRKYYMSIVNKVLWEFYWEHLSKPGKGVALFVGFLLLLMTCAQTFFSWRDWSRNHHHSQTHKTPLH